MILLMTLGSRSRKMSEVCMYMLIISLIVIEVIVMRMMSDD